MHSWHTGLSARIRPSCLASVNAEFGSPAISPPVSSGRSIFFGCARAFSAVDENRLLFAPAADGVETLQAETDRIHQPVARSAGGVLDVRGQALPVRQRLVFGRLGQRGIDIRAAEAARAGRAVVRARRCRARSATFPPARRSPPGTIPAPASPARRARGRKRTISNWPGGAGSLIHRRQIGAQKAVIRRQQLHEISVRRRPGAAAAAASPPPSPPPSPA